MTTDVETYFAAGCGRCPLGNTPQCKVHTWAQELAMLRRIVLECGLVEEAKWGVPCYTFQQKNILIVSAFNDYASLSFFKGALLHDAHNVLVKPGEHSQAARVMRFANVREVVALEAVLKAYIYEAVEVEKAGLKVNFSEKTELQLPDELVQKFEANPALKAAFEALTPGRQRAYNLHFSAPKQSKTRLDRIEKSVQDILSGIGYNEAYRKGLK